MHVRQPWLSGNVRLIRRNHRTGGGAVWDDRNTTLSASAPIMVESLGRAGRKYSYATRHRGNGALPRHRGRKSRECTQSGSRSFERPDHAMGRSAARCSPNGGGGARACHPAPHGSHPSGASGSDGSITRRGGTGARTGRRTACLPAKYFQGCDGTRGQHDRYRVA